LVITGEASESMVKAVFGKTPMGVFETRQRKWGFPPLGYLLVVWEQMHELIYGPHGMLAIFRELFPR